MKLPSNLKLQKNNFGVPQLYNPSLHKTHKSEKFHNQQFLVNRKDSGRSINKNNLSLVHLPTFGSFAQSLGRISSAKNIPHAQTERDLMEEINEDHNESLDDFLFNERYRRESQSIDNGQFKRFSTEQPRTDKSFLKSNIIRKEGEIGSNSIGPDNLQESYQWENSDLFMESQRNGRLLIQDLYQPEMIESDHLNSSESSSDIEDSPADNNSGSKTHDTGK